MRRQSFWIVPLLLLGLAAPVAAAPFSYNVFLDGPSEEPPNASPGTGTAVVTIDSVAHTLSVNAIFSELMGITTVAHIHVINGPGDMNLLDTLGPVATTTPSFVGFPTGVTAGTFMTTLDTTLASSYRPGWITDSGGTTAAAELALFDAIADGRAYLNIHTNMFPAGEIRGFLAPVPEPGTYALLLLGLGLLGWQARRKASVTR